MYEKNLLVISNNYPNQDNSYVADIFVKEQIKYLKNYFNNVYVISPVAYGIERLRKTTYKDYHYDNVKVFFPKYLNFPFLYSHGKLIWISLEVKAIISLIATKKITFDFIHAHMTWPSGAVAVELKKRFKVPVIITEHTSSTFNNAVNNNDLCWKSTLNTSDAIICVKNGDIALFERFNVQKDKIHVIPNGFDAKKFFPMSILKCRNLLGLPYDKKILLNVGNLYSPEKGHKFFIEAISHIITVRQDILGIIIGSGKLAKQLNEQIEELQLGQFIRLVGSKPYPEIPIWMNACDLFVLPSLSESFGIAQLEAMACGKPVIATRNGGSDNLITSEKFGFLCETKNAHALAQNIIKGLDRRWDVNEILQHTKQYHWELVCKKILDVYKANIQIDNIIPQ